MYLDAKMIKIIADKFTPGEEDSDLFVSEHMNLMWELILMKAFNHYAENLTEKERNELEKLMHNVAVFSRVEDQKKVMQILKKTITENPELAEEIRDTQNEIQRSMFAEFMKAASADEQIELLSYMLKRKKEIGSQQV